MLKVPQLDQVTYEQIKQRAVSRIPALTAEWTDFNSHDPGITVLELYAWLTDMLDYYMDATGDAHVEKYLKLLGIRPKTARPASGYVVLEGAGDGVIPGGTVLLAGDIPFETKGEYRVETNRFCAFLREEDGELSDLTAFAGVDGDYAEMFRAGTWRSQAAYFGFAKPLQQGDALYLCVEQNEKRNPFSEPICLAELKWQIFTENEWTDIEVEDDTCGFLRSGFVRPALAVDMQPLRPGPDLPEAYYIRAVLKENTYDCSPRLGRVFVNPLPVEQRRTICREGERLEGLRIGVTDGCAGQELLFDYPDAWKFSLLICGVDGETAVYRYREDLEEAGYEEQVFTYDRSRQMIRFGDGIHGAVPRQKQEIYVTGLVTSLCGAGNIQAGELRTFENEESFPYRIHNPLAIENGRSREILREMLGRLEQELFTQRRLAAERDYEEIIGRTPGLMLEKVHVIPGRVYGELHRQEAGANEVVVVVKPWSEEKCPELSPIYQKMLEAYLEPFRLINTKVRIVPPRYVGVEVYGRIALKRDTPTVRRAVWECLQQEIGGKGKDFGAVISYGRLYTALENLEGVEGVRELNLERTGAAADKNNRGDLLLHEDALAYLKETAFEFC